MHFFIFLSKESQVLTTNPYSYHQRHDLLELEKKMINILSKHEKRTPDKKDMYKYIKSHPFRF